MWSFSYITRRQLDRVVDALEERLSLMEASQAQNQASIDAETAKVDAVDAKLVTIKDEVDALKAAHAAGQALDFSKLDASLATQATQADTDVADAAAPKPPVVP